MKFYRNAIILVVVLVLLIVGYVVISKTNTGDTAITATTTPVQNVNVNIVSLDSAKVNKVTIQNKGEQIILSKSKATWVLTKPTGIKTNQDQIVSAMSGITGLIADRVIEKKATKLSQYGLDKPVAEIIIKTSDNKSQTLELGNETPTKEGYYLLDKGSSKVFSVSTYTIESILNTKNQIMDTTLFTFDVDPTSQLVKDVKTVAMDRNGKALFSAKLSSASTWTMTVPFEVKASSDVISQIIDLFSKLTIISFIDDSGKNLGKYGLSTPAYAIEVDTSKKKNKLLLGSMLTGSGEEYAMLEGSKVVFTIDSSTLTFLDKPLKEIFDHFIYLLNIDSVKQIAVSIDGRTDISKIKIDKGTASVPADKEKDQLIFKGKDATAKDANDNQPFRRYFEALIGITFDAIEQGAVVPNVKPEISITYTLNQAPGVMKIEFISKDKDYYYVVKNGKYSNFLVQKSQFDNTDGVRDSYKTLMAIINKK